MSVYDPTTDSPSMAVGTRDSLKPAGWFSELQTYTRYPICELIMNGECDFQAGKKMTWRAADDAGTAKARTAPYSTYTADRQGTAYECQMNWRFGIETCAISKFDIAMAQGDAQLIDEKALEISMYQERTCKSIEDSGWQVRAPSDTLNEQGIPYYVVCPSNAPSTGIPSFCGILPVGHTAVANIDPQTTHQKYRNAAALYTTFTNADFGVTCSNMMRLIDWTPPPKGPSEYNPLSVMRIYAGGLTISQMELMGVNNNDQNGYDTVPGHGKMTLKTFQVTEVPSLQAFAAPNSMPIYFCNHSKFGLRYTFLNGYRFAEEGPLPIPMSDQTHWKMEWVYNLKCVSRRRLGVIAKSAPFGEGAFS